MIEPDFHTRKAIQDMGRFRWKKTWTFWPRRCRISHARMRMFATAYRGHRILSGPGEDILLTRWISPETFMFQKLKGNI